MTQDPICPDCGKVMKDVQNGVVVYMTDEDRPDYIQFVMIGDRHECPVCGKAVIADFGTLLKDGLYSQEQLRTYLRRTHKVKLVRD